MMENFPREGSALLVLVLVIAGVLAIGGGVYYMVKKQGPSRQPRNVPTVVNKQPPLQQPGDISALVFKSGFEEGVFLKNPNPISGANQRWTQEISGVDSVTGFRWPDDLPGNGENARFTYLVDAGKDLGSILGTRIEEIEGHNGDLTRALYQEVKKKYQNTSGKFARNQFNIINNQDNVFREIRVTYWMKIQPDLESVMPANTWRQITEIRGKDDTYRITLAIHRRNLNEPLFWVLAGQTGPVWADQNNDWIISNAKEESGLPTVNRDLDIPIGTWFPIEFYVKQSPGDDGRFTLKINGNIYADHAGRTSLESPFASWHIFKVYAAPRALDAGTHYQWIDDFEVFSK